MELVIDNLDKLLKHIEKIKKLDDKNEINKLLDKEIIRNNAISMSYENFTITSESDRKVKQTHNFNMLIANNVVTSNLLAGNTVLDTDMVVWDKITCKNTYVHNTFLHIPESMHFLSAELVYEVNEYKTYYVKMLDGFVTVKD